MNKVNKLKYFKNKARKLKTAKYVTYKKLTRSCKNLVRFLLEYYCNLTRSYHDLTRSYDLTMIL